MIWIQGTVFFAGYHLQKAFSELLESDSWSASVHEEEIYQRWASLFKLECLNEIIESIQVDVTVSILVARKQMKQLLLVGIYNVISCSLLVSQKKVSNIFLRQIKKSQWMQRNFNFAK